MQLKLLNEQMMVVKYAAKGERQHKITERGDFEMKLVLDFTEEITRQRWQKSIKIRGSNSFVANLLLEITLTESRVSLTNWLTT